VVYLAIADGGDRFEAGLSGRQHLAADRQQAIENSQARVIRRFRFLADLLLLHSGDGRAVRRRWT
jgi:hypothetical protein